MPEFLSTAISAAREAGQFLRHHANSEKIVDGTSDYDIKLELDVRTQDLITDILLKAYPDHALFGEEGIAGNQNSPYQWVVDPIDGTVNFFFGIPHYCVSIALRKDGQLTHGVIYDPSLDELWTVTHDQPASLNGRPIHCSLRSELRESVMTIGFSKSLESIESGLQVFGELSRKIRKNRMLGSAALALAYVATGRLDAYIEEEISLWDIAAGLQLVESAGGKVRLTPREGEHEKYRIVAWNGLIPVEDVVPA